MTTEEKLRKCFKSLRSKTDFVPEIALVLGSGLGDYAGSIDVVDTIPYKDIDGFPVSTAPGHKGQYVFGYINEIAVVIMQGRVHYYEGYSIEDVVLPERLMKLMGAKVLFLTNAAGGINSNFNAGDFMLITDHISSFVPNPLIGANIDSLGVRFPDMSEIYNKKLNAIIRFTADKLGIALHEGVYLQLTGPSYESPAEIKMAKTIGADAVGMSTACEAIAANHAGMLVCAISCISNLAAGISKTPLTHKEVQQTGALAAPKFKQLITISIQGISNFLHAEDKRLENQSDNKEIKQ